MTALMLSYSKDLPESLTRLNKAGGQYKRAAITVQSLMGKSTMGALASDLLSTLKTTNHGESRINKCVKYDLTGRCRLITIQDNGCVHLCFAGTHDDADKWLDKNRGLTLVRDKRGRANVVQMRASGDNPEQAQLGLAELRVGPMLDRLPEEDVEVLLQDLNHREIRAIGNLTASDNEAEIQAACQPVADDERRMALEDALLSVRLDKDEQAKARLDAYLGRSLPVAELSDEEICAMVASKQVQFANSYDPNYQKVFDYILDKGSYMEWMLFLHPDQQKFVDTRYSGVAKLSGVSGSGKTCILVKRALALALESEHETVLILTLNRQLAKLIHEMVESLCPDDVRQRIEVKPLFQLSQELLHEFEPQNDKLYDDVTWKSQEHIDEIWREFYRCELNNNSARILERLHDSLIARNVDAEQYIREEFDWLRSALAPQERKKYLSIERKGRGYNLDKRHRHLVIDGLSAWEKKMEAIGISDYLGLSTALQKHLDKIEPRYRHILVDESQDFGTIEYRLIRHLVSKSGDDLFFCGDAAQQISPKHASFKAAGIDLPSVRSFKISQNYRNGREILEAAYSILESNLSEQMLESEDFEILSPEHANFSSSAPIMLEAQSPAIGFGHALNYINEELDQHPSRKGCLVLCGYSLHQIQHFGRKVGLPVLDGTSSIGDKRLHLSDLEHSKGFEFDYVIILNCVEGVLPDAFKPEAEQHRDLARFYVAMTRAKHQLVISYSGERSSLLMASDDHFLTDSWINYLPCEKAERHGMPPSLNAIRNQGDPGQLDKRMKSLSGPDFLYTRKATGLPSLLIEKLRKVIPGRGRIINGERVEWETIEMAERDIGISPRSRQAFGPEGLKQFKHLLDDLGGKRQVDD